MEKRRSGGSCYNIISQNDRKANFCFCRRPIHMPRKTKKTGYFVSANGNAKSDAVAVLVRAARRARLDYDGFLYVCQQARRKLKLARPAREQVPHLHPAG
jgi:hypothetical protein